MKKCHVCGKPYTDKDREDGSCLKCWTDIIEETDLNQLKDK